MDTSENFIKGNFFYFNMAKLRKFCAYRRVERPYTRISRFRKKAFIRASPHKTIVKYHMGNLTKAFPFRVDLISKSDLQLRHNAFESARMSCNRLLEKTLGKKEFFFHVRPYPHHIIRENPLASGAGADRMSTGMKLSFGKTISAAAQIKRGQIVFSLGVNKIDLDTAKLALKRASYKLPSSYSITITEMPKVVK